MTAQARRYGRRAVTADPPQDDLPALWRATRERLSSSVPESTWKLWLEPLELVGGEGETLFLSAPEGIRAWTERRYSALIGEALREAGSPFQQVSFAAPPEGSGSQANPDL